MTSPNVLELLIKTGHRIKPVTPYVNNKAVQQVVADTQLVYGMELEIENAQEGWRTVGMDVTTDGSLRNGGLEFITKPMTGSVLFYVLENFFNKAKPGEECYSDRTSIHVHTNVQDLTVDQLTSVLMLYQVFENQLFRFAGQDRDKNIFCVPWSQTAYTYNIGERIAYGAVNVAARWAKYTALNLAPMCAQGTIEFRHMPGTADLTKIKTWCNLIGRLFHYARNIELSTLEQEICALNTNSHYHIFVDKVFGGWAEHLKFPAFEIDLEDGVLNVKYMLLEKEVPNKKVAVAFQEAQEGVNHVDNRWIIQGGHGAVFGVNAAQGLEFDREEFDRQQRLERDFEALRRPVQPAPRAEVNAAGQRDFLDVVQRMNDAVARDRAERVVIDRNRGR